MKYLIEGRQVRTVQAEAQDRDTAAQAFLREYPDHEVQTVTEIHERQDGSTHGTCHAVTMHCCCCDRPIFVDEQCYLDFDLDAFKCKDCGGSDEQD